MRPIVLKNDELVELPFGYHTPTGSGAGVCLPFSMADGG